MIVLPRILVCPNGDNMSIARIFLIAMLMALAGLVPSIAQTVYDVEELAISTTQSGSTPDVGLYDTLSAADYERVGQDLSVLSQTQFSLEKFRNGVLGLFEESPKLLPDLNESIAEMSPSKSSGYFAGITLAVLLMFAAAYMIEHHIYGLRLVGPWFVKLQVAKPRGVVEKLPLLALRAVLGLVGIIISLVIVGLLILAFIDLSDPATQKTVLVLVPTIAIARASAIIWRMVLSPYLPNYRIPVLSDKCSRKLFNWLWVSVTISLVLIAFTYWLEDLKTEDEPYRLVTFVAAVVIMVVNIAMIMANRQSISESFLGDRDWKTATLVAKTGYILWAPLAALYIFLSWAYQSFKLVVGIDIGQPPIIGAYSILLAVLVAYGVVAFVIARLFEHRRRLVEARAVARAAEAAENHVASMTNRPSGMDPKKPEGDPSSDDGDDEGGPSGFYQMTMQQSEVQSQLHGLRDFEDLARRVATIFAVGAGLYALASIWDLEHLFNEGRILGRALDMTYILLVGYIAHQGVRIWIDTKIEEELGDMPEEELGGDGGGASSVSRLATLLPLFRNLMLFLILATVLLLVLLEAGINVAPLFAGAGVVGLAIGFGAQALIRDILSGAFFLVDDAFRRGEYIDIGAVKGTVERISMRSFQLRHHLGALHTIPFGEIQHLTNYSRDWVMMKLPLRVTYDTDVEKVRKLIKKLGVELLEHPTEGEKFVQPLKSQGVYRMEDSAMIIRVKFMTRPGDQWTTRKLVYQRIREVFEANGIKFAHREVTVRLGDRKADDLSTEEREAIGAAAQQATVAADEGTRLAANSGGMDDR